MLHILLHEQFTAHLEPLRSRIIAHVNIDCHGMYPLVFQYHFLPDVSEMDCQLVLI